MYKFSIMSFLLLLVLTIALLSAFYYQIASPVNHRLLLIAAKSCLASFVIAISFRDRRQSYLLIPVGLAVLLFAYACFTHYRLHAFTDSSFPRPLPYPDMLIHTILESIPVSETWKGMVLAVKLGAILFAVVAGTLLGMVCRPGRQSRDNNAMNRSGEAE